MRRLIHHLPAARVGRHVSAAAFAKNIADIQSVVVKEDMKREVVRRVKSLFETEQLDSRVDGQIDVTADEAGIIAQTAAQKSVNVSRSPVMLSVYDWALTQSSVATLSSSPLALSRILHSALVLRSASLYELAFTYLRSFVLGASSLEPTVCAVVVNVYGRCGIHHEELWNALEGRLIETLKDPSIALAHIANVAQALSKVQASKGAYNKQVFLLLRDQAVKLHAQATPLMLVTILDSFASVGFVDDELCALYESRLTAVIEECSPGLLGAVLQTCTKGHRTASPLFDSVANVAKKKMKDFDSFAVAVILDAYCQAQRPNEELFALAAEQACKQVMHFRSNEIAMTLRALAAFDLFDAELFPLMASRFVSIVASSEIAFDDAVLVLEAFATVHERHEALLNATSTLILPYVPQLTPVQFVTTLWALEKLNYRSETHAALVAALQMPDRQDLLNLVFPNSPTYAARAAELKKFCSPAASATSTAMDGAGSLN